MLNQILVERGRRFQVCLRYDAPSKCVIANAILTDTPEAVAIYLDCGENEEEEKEEENEDKHMSVHWNPYGDESLELPPSVER